jgi:hypothetical protein
VCAAKTDARKRLRSAAFEVVPEPSKAMRASPTQTQNTKRKTHKQTHKQMMMVASVFSTERMALVVLPVLHLSINKNREGEGFFPSDSYFVTKPKDKSVMTQSISTNQIKRTGCRTDGSRSSGMSCVQYSRRHKKE